MTKENDAPESAPPFTTRNLSENMRSRRDDLLTIPFCEHTQKIYAVTAAFSRSDEVLRTYGFSPLDYAVEYLRSCPTGGETYRLELETFSLIPVPNSKTVVTNSPTLEDETARV